MKSNNNDKRKIWQDAKEKYRLSSQVIMMARQLGLNPKKFGSVAIINKSRGKCLFQILYVILERAKSDLIK